MTASTELEAWRGGLRGALGALALAAACGGEPLPRMAADGTLLALLTSDVEREVVSEDPAAPVRMLTLSPNPERSGSGGVLRALAVAPGSEVRFEIPARGPRAELVYTLGIHHLDPRSSAIGAARAVFELDVAGTPLRVDLDLPPIAARGDGTWTSGRLALPQGGTLVVRTRYEGAGPPPVLAISRLEVVVPIDVRRTRATPRSPNVVLILVDTLRADRLGCYGYARPTTPEVDALAARGAVFERAYSAASWTWPSTASVLTALSPPEHGVLSHDACYLAEELVSLAEPLQLAGLTTAAFSTNPLISAGQNYDQGFERYWERMWATGPEALPEVERFLDELGEYRFFLYLHLTDPHRPYKAEEELQERFAADVPPGYTADGFFELMHAVNGCADVPAEPLRSWTRHVSDLYDAEVASMDRVVGRLFARLAALGLLDRTVIAFTSDHGEEFLEHGRFAHGQQLHEETLRVPLVLAGPGIPAGMRVARPVENRFLAPTLLALARVDAPANLGAASLLDERAPEPPSLFFNTEIGVVDCPGERSLSAVRTAREHFVWGPPDPEQGRAEIARYYDLARDPDALSDAATVHPERVEALKHEIGRWWLDGAARRPHVYGGGEGMEDFLEGLGYVDGRRK